MTSTTAYGVAATDAPVAPLEIERRELRGNDVEITIHYCGVCHSDLHTARGDWGPPKFPCVPGHEIVGEVTAVGADVTDHKVGDHVAVGTVVDSCMGCSECEGGHEVHCLRGATFTYGSKDRVDGTVTHGGYSHAIVTRDHFVLKMPDGLDASRAGPILCAGITVWTPLREHGVEAGTKLGVVGLGGLGHMAVKLGAALGAEVTVFTTSPDKERDAKDLGAHHVVLSKEPDAMTAAMGTLDVIIDTVPVAHDFQPYLDALGPRGTLVLVGAIAPLKFHGGKLIVGNKRLAGSLTGGIPRTQELLDFCAEHGVHPDVEMVKPDGIGEAWEKMEAGEVKYRFVIDFT